MADLPYKNRVPETAEYRKKGACNSLRPHVDVVPGGNGTGTCLTRADTCIKEHASGAWFSLTSVVCFITLSRPLRLTIVTDHELGVDSTITSDLPGHSHRSSTPGPY
jgi:hypothetical protein